MPIPQESTGGATFKPLGDTTFRPFGPRLSNEAISARQRALAAQESQKKSCAGFTFQKEPLPDVPWCASRCLSKPLLAASCRSLEKACRLDSVEELKRMASTRRPSSAFKSIFKDPEPESTTSGSSKTTHCPFGPLITNPFGPIIEPKVCSSIVDHQSPAYTLLLGTTRVPGARKPASKASEAPKREGRRQLHLDRLGNPQWTSIVTVRPANPTNPANHLLLNLPFRIANLNHLLLNLPFRFANLIDLLWNLLFRIANRGLNAFFLALQASHFFPHTPYRRGLPTPKSGSPAQHRRSAARRSQNPLVPRLSQAIRD